MMREPRNFNEEDSIFDHIEDLIVLIAIIAVIFLKLLGVIKISWFWLLCPIWGSFAIIILMLIGVGIYTLIDNIRDYIYIKRRNKNERY